MEKNTKKNRNFYMDFLNVVACYFVVILHCTNSYFIPDASSRWFMSAFLQSITICAVPLFFMLSGANLLEYQTRYTTLEFYKKRFIKVCIPFFAWSMIYAIWKVYTNQLKILNFIDFLKKFINNEINSIFWFFYAIIGLYAAMPILNVLTKDENKKTLWLLLGLCCFNSAQGIISCTLDINLGYFTVPVASSSIGYVILGHLLKNEIPDKRTVKYAVVTGIGLIIINFFGTIYYTYGGLIGLRGTFDNANVVLNKTFNTSGSLSVMVYAACVFIILKSIVGENKIFLKMQNIIVFLSDKSLGVYFLQMIVIYYIQHLCAVDTLSIKYSLVAPFVIYWICVIITAGIKKIPILKYLIP